MDIWKIWSVLAVTCCLVATPAIADEGPPNGTLTIGYRQLLDGSLSKAVYYATLTCYDGDCTMTTVTLNQCLPTPFGTEEAFIPKVERSSTSDGNLSVRMRDDNRLIITETNGETIYTYHFTFAYREDKDLATLLKSKQTRFFAEKQAVQHFTGGAIKDSTAMAKIISWELVALKNPGKGVWPVIEPACKIALPDGGIDGS
jgi:hypothetical protein